MNRRSFIGILGSAAFGASNKTLRIGAMDGVFRLAGNPEAVALAKRAGLASTQVTLGRSTDGRTLPLEDPTRQAAWRAASREHGIPLASTYIDMLHAE